MFFIFVRDLRSSINIVFVSSNTFNFAQAQLMMVGTFVAYTGLVTLKLPVLVVAVMATVAGAV